MVDAVEPENKLNLCESPRICLIHLRQIGDVLMTTPAIKAVRRSYPDAYIRFVTETAAAPMIEHNPHLDEVQVLQRHLKIRNYPGVVAGLYRQRFDLAIDFMGNPKSAQLTFFSRAGRRLGWRRRGRNYAYNLIPPGQPEPNLYSPLAHLELIGHIGLNWEDVVPEFYNQPGDKDEPRAWLNENFSQLPGKDAGPLIACWTVSRRSYKIWPQKYFAEVFRRLAAKYNARFVIIYSPDEKEEALKLTQYMDEATLKRTVTDYPNFSLGQLKEVLACCDLFIGNDGGPRHIAITAGVPTATPFGRNNYRNWTPPGTESQNLALFVPDIPCREKCKFEKCSSLDCLTQIEPDSMVEAAGGLLDKLTNNYKKI
jgi:ADP-heptose:LPS heptosyltransferase